MTLARAATNTFAGIRPGDVFPFVVAQVLGAIVAILLFRWLVPGDLAVHEVPEDPLSIDPKETKCVP